MIEDVRIGDSEGRGKGVFARRTFVQGEFIFRRRFKRIVAAAEIDALEESERMHLCELDFDRSGVLASPGCYLNHSCDPNAMRHGVKVFAWQPVAAGEEIAIDYRLNAFDDDETWPCECGAPDCEGSVAGSFFSMSPVRQQLLLEHAPVFIRADPTDLSATAPF